MASVANEEVVHLKLSLAVAESECRIMKRKIYKISREKAIQIAMNHNCVNKEIAERYTDSELKEILKHLNLKVNF